MATVLKSTGIPLPFIHPDTMPDLYAVPGVGRCMEPLIADGTLLVFDKRQEPRPGDIVVLWFTSEAARRCGVPGWVKRLTVAPPPAGFDGLIIIEQLSPPRHYSVPTTDILAIHKSTGTAESTGKGSARYNPNKGGF